MTNNIDDTMSVIDTMTDTQIHVLQIGDGPGGMLDQPVGVAVPPDGRKVYLTSVTSNGGLVYVSDHTSDPPAVLANPVPVGNGPFGIAVHPDGSRVYVTNFYDEAVSVIATATNTRIDTDLQTPGIQDITLGGDFFAFDPLGGNGPVAHGQK